MDCLWESAPHTVREAVENMKKHVGWMRSTTLTMLRRMTEKGIISCDETVGVESYSPMVKCEDTVMQETENILKRVYKGSVSKMMSAVTMKQKLTREEIDEL
jgi:BlaI family penicillinase repressor